LTTWGVRLYKNEKFKINRLIFKNRSMCHKTEANSLFRNILRIIRKKQKKKEYLKKELELPRAREFLNNKGNRS
jgi:hypothetical protein